MREVLLLVCVSVDLIVLKFLILNIGWDKKVQILLTIAQENTVLFNLFIQNAKLLANVLN